MGSDAPAGSGGAWSTDPLPGDGDLRGRIRVVAHARLGRRVLETHRFVVRDLDRLQRRIELRWGRIDDSNASRRESSVANSIDHIEPNDRDAEWVQRGSVVGERGKRWVEAAIRPCRWLGVVGRARDAHRLNLDLRAPDDIRGDRVAHAHGLVVRADVTGAVGGDPNDRRQPKAKRIWKRDCRPGCGAEPRHGRRGGGVEVIRHLRGIQRQPGGVVTVALTDRDRVGDDRRRRPIDVTNELVELADDDPDRGLRADAIAIGRAAAEGAQRRGEVGAAAQGTRPGESRVATRVARLLGVVGAENGRPTIHLVIDRLHSERFVEQPCGDSAWSCCQPILRTRVGLRAQRRATEGGVEQCQGAELARESATRLTDRDVEPGARGHRRRRWIGDRTTVQPVDVHARPHSVVARGNVHVLVRRHGAAARGDANPGAARDLELQATGAQSQHDVAGVRADERPRLSSSREVHPAGDRKRVARYGQTMGGDDLAASEYECGVGRRAGPIVVVHAAVGELANCGGHVHLELVGGRRRPGGERRQRRHHE